DGGQGGRERHRARGRRLRVERAGGGRLAHGRWLIRNRWGCRERWFAFRGGLTQAAPARRGGRRGRRTVDRRAGVCRHRRRERRAGFGWIRRNRGPRPGL